MQAEIITVGDELLIGQTIDTNSAWMGSKLNEVGVDVRQVRSISDDASDIQNALNSVLPDTRLVLITGGLGPTKDDITKHTLTNYFGGELVFKEEVFEHITELFRQYGRDLSRLNRDQALLPSNCEVLKNRLGTASGMKFTRNGVVFISMPGVPYEMKGLMRDHVLPWLEKELANQRIIHRTLLTQGVPESLLAQQLEDFENQLPSHIKLAYLPSPGLVKLRLTSKMQHPEVEAEVDAQLATMRTILGAVVFGENTDTLEGILGKMLVEKGQTISTAESCTGGYLAHRFTAVPGSSAYFMGSVVAYDNAVKTNVLGVSAELIRQHGAVSEAVVCAMAQGARQLLGTTWALATSGIAGPDGGSAEKPVGTVWIALAGEAGVQAQVFRFGSDRERNIRKSALMALDILRQELIS